MKRIIFITFAIAFAAMTMNAQPAARLIKKYSKVEGAEYIDAIKMAEMGNFEVGDNGQKVVEAGAFTAPIAGNISECKILTVEECKPSVAKKFWKGIKSLKNYSIINISDEDDLHMRVLINVEEVNGDSIVDAVWAFAFIPEDDDDDASFDMMYLKGKNIPGDKISLLTTEGKTIPSGETIRKADLSDPLIVIDGQIHPELHNYKDVEEYFAKQEDFINHKISYLYDGVLFGSQVKEKYPNSTKNIALIYKTVEQHY